MENIESDVYLVSKSHCRVGKITAKKRFEEVKSVPETETKTYIIER
ncbi:hypothetical protein [Flavobacterium sp. LB2P44]